MTGSTLPISALREAWEKTPKGPYRIRTNRHPTTGGEDWGWVSGPDDQNLGIRGTSFTWEGQAGRDFATFIALAHREWPVLLSAIERMEKLEQALRHEIKNCPLCKGEGVTNQTAAHVIFRSLPAEEKVDCPRCASSRAALTGDQPQ